LRTGNMGRRFYAGGRKKPKRGRIAKPCSGPAVAQRTRMTRRAGQGKRLPCQGATMSADCAQRRLQIGERLMNPLVAVIAPGMMGAAVGKRLTDHGLKVLTSLQAR